MSFEPDVHRVLHRHPFPNVGQGCVMEGMVLALEGRFEPFSRGRGFITPERVQEIESIAAAHFDKLPYAAPTATVPVA